MEIQSKSLISAIPKEIASLWVAHHLAKQKVTDLSQRSTIIAEIRSLLDGYARTKKCLARVCTSNSQPQQKQYNKKRKKEEELHKGQESLQPGEQSKALEEDREKNPQQMQQQHLKRPRPCTPKLLTPAVPLVLNTAQIGHFGRPPYSVMPEVPSYSTQTRWPGVGGALPFTPSLEAAQYIRPFNPFYPHLQFYPR